MSAFDLLVAPVRSSQPAPPWRCAECSPIVGLGAVPDARRALRRAAWWSAFLLTLATMLASAPALSQGTPRAAAAGPAPMRVAVVTDGPTDREIFSAALIERAMAEVATSDRPAQFPQNLRFTGNWTLASVDAALDSALADPSVDIILTLGVLSSQQAAHRARLAKPVIAPVVIDPVLQKFPLTAGTSGRRNFTYVADFQAVENDVQAFHRMTGFRHLVAVVDSTLWSSLPELATKVDTLSSLLSARISVIQAMDDPTVVLSAIPADADAVLLTGLLRFTDADVRELAAGLIARRLPSFSNIGRSEVEGGILMTTGGAQREVERLARRVALMIQRAADGEDLATFEVGFPTEQHLMINMRTAAAIGYSPRWEDLADAEQLDADAGPAAETVSLVQAMNNAVAANPALNAVRERVQSTAQDVNIARSDFFPSLDISAAHTQIDSDRASVLTQAEKTTSAGVGLQQILYSEGVWANYSISRSLLEASRHGERTELLDTLASTASSYLDVLRASAIEAVRRSNVDNTRKNLEIARVREAVGLGGRTDLLRWVAELARDKQELLGAESTRRQAETELARIMHRSSSQPFRTGEAGLDDPLQLIASPRMRAFLDTPAKWDVFTGYAVQTALQQSPEIAQTDAIVASRQRALTAARRSVYLPDLALVSNGSRALERSGAGSESIPGGPDDEAWSVSLQAALPIYTGGLRKAQVSQARHELRASEADGLSARDGVEARIRASLHRTASSWPSIALSAQAAAAANENLAMVTDAYARGAVSITDLIDAQDTAQSAGLAAADAKYVFLIDLVGVMRAMNQFDVLLDPATREAWLTQVEQWFATHSPAAPRAPAP